MTTRFLGLQLAAALAASGQAFEVVPLVGDEPRHEPEPPKPKVITPHIGKKQIAKALRKARPR